MDNLYLHLWIDAQSHMICAYEVSNTKVKPSSIDKRPRSQLEGTTKISVPKLFYDATDIQYVRCRKKAEECDH